MKNRKLFLTLTCFAFLAGCGAPAGNNTVNNAVSNATNSSPAVQNLTIVERPQKIREMMAGRGQQDEAEPTLKIISPAANSTVNSSTVMVKLDLSGDLKGYQPHKDPATQMGNHIHVILDNQPYEAYYELGAPFELRNVSDGEHTLRVFPSRPWHESYKNDGAFQMVRFTVKNGGGDDAKPTTTNSGRQMSNANSNTNAATEGKDMSASTAGAVDLKKPLLTYSRPKGEYKGADADAIMIDLWLENAKLTGEDGEYRIRYTIDGGEAKYLDKWEPIWLSGWAVGKHSVKLELVDKTGNVVDNGGYNATTREITVTE
jgi:hypothetical protein